MAPNVVRTWDLPGDVASRNVLITWWDSQNQAKLGRATVAITSAIVAYDHQSEQVNIRAGIHKGTYSKTKDAFGKTVKRPDLNAAGASNHYTAEFQTPSDEWRNFHYFVEEDEKGAWVTNDDIRPNPEKWGKLKKAATKKNFKNPLKERVVLCKKGNTYYVRYKDPPEPPRPAPAWGDADWVDPRATSEPRPAVSYGSVDWGDWK